MLDIIIVGAGGAGLSCAIEAKQKGAKIAVLCQSMPTNSATCMAQGGINGVIYDDLGDSTDLHVKDTIKSSLGLASIEIVQDMCEGAKEDISWLDDMGMPFSRSGEKIAQRKFGATSKDRTIYSQDYTGLKLLHTLYDNCLKNDIDFLDNSLLLDLHVEDSTCKGIIYLDIKTGEIKSLYAKSVVLATGGYAGIYHGFTTNAKESTGDGVAVALRAGAVLSDMEFVQFHPTSLKHSSVLVSESARGAGGFLVNQNGDRFVNELMTRDEVARSVFSQIQDGNEVFLDIRHLGASYIDKNLPQEKKLIVIHEHLDPSKDLIPIAPAAHYSMGGIDVDKNLHSSIKGLFAVGECANVKAHGANRLGGNSLLEIIHFGRTVANTSYMYAKGTVLHVKEKASNNIDHLFSKDSSETFFDLKNTLGKELFKKAGIFRDEKRLKELLEEIKQIQKVYNKLTISDDNMSYNDWLVLHIKFANTLQLAEAVTLSALRRDESRGAHYRNDKIDMKEKALHSFVELRDGSLHVSFEDDVK